jgi:hypothetical protein
MTLMELMSGMSCDSSGPQSQGSGSVTGYRSPSADRYRARATRHVDPREFGGRSFSSAVDMSAGLQPRHGFRVLLLTGTLLR